LIALYSRSHSVMFRAAPNSQGADVCNPSAALAADKPQMARILAPTWKRVPSNSNVEK